MFERDRDMLAQEQSQNAQNKLNEIETWANSEEGKYVKINDGDVRHLSFSLEKMELVTKPFYDTNTGQPKPSTRVNFTVSDLDSPFEGTEEKIWSASKTWAKDVVKFLKAGECLLTIKRTGSGLKDTKYHIEPYRGS